MHKRGSIWILVFLIGFVILTFALDTDKDGLPDEYEILNGLDHYTSNLWTDSDLDGLADTDEYAFNTSPVNKDTDGDGYTDKEEYDRGSDPLSKISPRYVFLLKFAMPALLGLFIISLIIYLFSLIKPDKGKTSEPTPKKAMTNKKKAINLLGDLSEFILGPSISKARERDRQIEKKELEGMEDIALDSSKVLQKLEFDDWVETKYDKLVNVDKKVVFTPSSEDFGFQLKRILRDNKRKNKVSDILNYFDKEMDEELPLLEEKKNKKEIADWYNTRKEMRDKIIDLAKEEKEQLAKAEPVLRKEPTIFDKLDDINKK